MNPKLAGDIINYCGALMIPAERPAYSHLIGTMKATMGRSDVWAQREAKQHRSFSRFLRDDPEVLCLTSDGYQSFVERTAERILAEHRNDVFLNRHPHAVVNSREHRKRSNAASVVLIGTL